MESIDRILELFNRLAQRWARHHCYACGHRFRGEGYQVLGRRYCCNLCAPAAIRQALAGDPGQ